ncbi:MAG: amidohydrolase family protein [Alphaproteobacteria bacterium]|nr:amidohydrolase family protein [Alphaproteobacteria bacterium]
MMIDADTHLREDMQLDAVYPLDGEFADLRPRRIGEGGYHQALFEHDLSPWPARAERSHSHKSLYDPERWEGRIARMQAQSMDMEARVAAFAEAGIEKQVLFGTNMDVPVLNRGTLGATLCRLYNDWAANLVTGRETALYPVALLPMGAPEAMAGELTRAITELGFKAALLGAYSLDHTLDEEVFEPTYAKAEELGVPLFVHPNSRGEMTNRFKNFYIMHTIARPTNCTAALVALVIGGVFERHPELKVAFFECNAEWMLYWMHRMDATYDYLKDDYAPYLALKPSDYVRRNCLLTCESHEPCLPQAIEEIGAENLLMASDYPHWDAGFPLVAREFAGRSDLSDRQKALITGENIARLMKL